MSASLIIIAAIAVAYLMVGSAITGRAMRHMRTNAFNDHDFFTMTIQDSRRLNLSTALPKITLTLLWPAALAFALVANLLTSPNREPAV